MALLTIERQKEIDQIIDGIREQYGTCPDQSIVEIVRKCGLTIYLHDFGEDSSVIKGAMDFKERAIYINKDMPERNQVFTIAHELGHYVIDGHHNQDVRYRIDFHSDLFPSNPTANLQETEANYFAGEILMPEATIRKKLRQNPQDATKEQVKQLAKYFKISELALRIRIAWIRKNPKN